jgi:hypothetical protein
MDVKLSLSPQAKNIDGGEYLDLGVRKKQEDGECRTMKNFIIRTVRRI